MTAPELLRDVEARGVAVRVVGDALKLKPAAALDARVLAEVRAEKLAIIALLRDRDAREYSQVAPPQKPTPAPSLFDDGESSAAPDAPASAPVACASTRSATAKQQQSSATGARRAPREFYAGAAYDPALAKEEAHRLYRAGEVTTAQCDNLLAYAAASTRELHNGATRR